MGAFFQGLTPSGPQLTYLDMVMLRLLCATFLGAIIGLERELKHKTAGLRTNTFICFGAALFTILSDQLAGNWAGDHTRIAAQIIPGIGFLGAGSIIQSRGSVTGLTTAATMFTGAAIGMASGAGLFVEAVFSTVVIMFSMFTFGAIERRFSIKAVDSTYEVAGDDAGALIQAINIALEKHHKMMQNMQVVDLKGHSRVQFKIEATRAKHRDILSSLREMPEVRNVVALDEI